VPRGGRELLGRAADEALVPRCEEPVEAQGDDANESCPLELTAALVNEAAHVLGAAYPLGGEPERDAVRTNDAVRLAERWQDTGAVAEGGDVELKLRVTRRGLRVLVGEAGAAEHRAQLREQRRILGREQLLDDERQLGEIPVRLEQLVELAGVSERRAKTSLVKTGDE